MSYRPITDVMILARSKTKYYGAFPAGFLHRAIALLGVGRDAYVLHVCAGKVREYPFRGFGKNHKTLDLNPKTKPDFLQDAREPFPIPRGTGHPEWDAVLIDRPYTDEDAEHYVAEGLEEGSLVLPTANQLVANAVKVLPVGGRVGIIDYLWPQPPKNATEVAVIAVGTGRNSRARWYTVFERME